MRCTRSVDIAFGWLFLGGERLERTAVASARAPTDPADRQQTAPDPGRVGGRSYRAWRVKDSNLRRLSRRIYSPLPLAARATRRAAGTGAKQYNDARTRVLGSTRAGRPTQRKGATHGRLVVRRRQQGRPPGGRQRAQPGRQGALAALRLPGHRRDRSPGPARRPSRSRPTPRSGSRPRSTSSRRSWSSASISLRRWTPASRSPPARSTRSTRSIKQGIESESAKKISKMIRDEGPKGVQAQIQGDQLRVTARSGTTCRRSSRCSRAPTSTSPCSSSTTADRQHLLRIEAASYRLGPHVAVPTSPFPATTQPVRGGVSGATAQAVTGAPRGSLPGSEARQPARHVRAELLIRRAVDLAQNGFLVGVDEDVDRDAEDDQIGEQSPTREGEKSARGTSARTATYIGFRTCR